MASYWVILIIVFMFERPLGLAIGIPTHSQSGTGRWGFLMPCIASVPQFYRSTWHSYGSNLVLVKE